MTPPLAIPAARRLGARSRWSFGLGSIAYGVKDSGFATFLLLFYNQVLGMDPFMVSVALAIAMVFDAVTDPVVGTLSDNLNTRWGRRHPLMLIASVPLGICLFMVFAPPPGPCSRRIVLVADRFHGADARFHDAVLRALGCDRCRAI